MANKHKGEIEFEAGGKTYKLSFSANAMCELEEAIDMDVDSLGAKLKNGETVRLAVLRTVFWQGLLDHQPEMTLDDTKLLLKHIKPNDMGRLLGEAFVASQPDEVKAAAEGPAGENPPKPAVPAAEQTGPVS